MRLHPHEFIRRFLLHVLPRGFHRIRHYGLFANAKRAENIATARALLGADPPAADPVTPDEPRALRSPCPRCGARMIVIEVFARGCEDRVPWRGVVGRLATAISGLGRIGQMTMAGNPTTGSSLKVAMVSRVM